MTDLAPVFLDRGDVATLIQLSGVDPAMCSPLLEVIAAAEPVEESAVRQKLQSVGWLTGDTPAGLSEEARAAMTSLLRPTISGRAVLGTRRTFGVLGLYAADPGEEYVALSESGDGYLITPDRTFGDLSTAVTGQVLLGPLEISMDFGAEFDPEGFAALAAILDCRTRMLLQATLDRNPYPDVRFDAREAWEMLVEGTSSDDPAWGVSLFRSLVPQVDFDLSEELVAAALVRLAESGHVTAAGEGGWRFSELLESFADAVQPFGSYAGVHLEAWNGDEPIEAAHLAIVRGPFALVVMRPMIDGGRRTVAVDAITDIELADLLTELAVTPIAADAGTAGSACPSCGGQVGDGQSYCAACGANLGNSTPEGRQPCPSCGVDTDPTEDAFCWNCGAGLRTSPSGGDAP